MCGSSTLASTTHEDGKHVQAPAAASNSREAPRLPLEMENSITARNNLKAAKERVVQTHKRQTKVAMMRKHLHKVKKDDLVFVDVSDLQAAEGELAIGLARVLEGCTGSGDCKLRWYLRKEWVKSKRHTWSAGPSFQWAGNPDPSSSSGRYYETMEPLERMLPIDVELTGTATYANPRLTSECVRVAREVCRQRGLVCKPPSKSTKQAAQCGGSSNKRKRNSASRRADNASSSMSDSEEEENDSSEEEDDSSE